MSWIWKARPMRTCGIYRISKMHCTSSIMPEAKLVDRDKLSQEFDLSLFDDDWLPSRPLRTLIYDFHRMLSATEYRLRHSAVLNEGALNRLDFRFDAIDHLNDAGYWRLEKDLKSLNNKISKFTKRSHLMIDKFENMESNVIPQQFVEWNVSWPSPDTESMISNHWPPLLESPTHEVGCCWWHCQIRKVPFFKNTAEQEMYYKLGVFVSPKQALELQSICSLRAKLKVTLSIQYKELLNEDKHHRYSPSEIIYNRDDEGNIIERIQMECNDVDIAEDVLMEPLEVKTDELSFDVDTNFVKLQDETMRLMSWGKFVPELQDIISPESGHIPHESVKIAVKFQVIEQCVTYKQAKTVQTKVR